MDRGGGQVVSMLALYWRSEFESSWSLQFFLYNLCLKRTKINKKEAGVCRIFEKLVNDWIKTQVLWVLKQQHCQLAAAQQSLPLQVLLRPTKSSVRLG